MANIAKVKNVGKKFIEAFNTHDLMTMAAALAFYTALALAPLLLITLSVVGLLGEGAKNSLINQIQGLMGPQAATAITSIVEAANRQPHTGGVAGMFGVIFLLFSAGGVFAQLQDSLNVIWDAQGEAPTGLWSWIRKRLLSMGMVLTLGFLALVSLVVSTVLSSMFTDESQVWAVINVVISGAIFAGMFSLIYKYLPDAKLSWKDASIGGIITAVLFIIGKTLIGLYIGKSAVGSAYGAAGSLIVFLSWVYYSSIIVFAGAEFTRIISGREIESQASAKLKAK
ncbi:MAG: YihY/virulence factor BrkB family protein [Bdellovibrionaceae bacterium]|nr:YihY/virulence factor BrkB family protein [Bdellovibrio sp.]